MRQSVGASPLNDVVVYLGHRELHIVGGDDPAHDLTVSRGGHSGPDTGSNGQQLLEFVHPRHL